MTPTLILAPFSSICYITQAVFTRYTCVYPGNLILKGILLEGQLTLPNHLPTTTTTTLLLQFLYYVFKTNSNIQNTSKMNIIYILQQF